MMIIHNRFGRELEIGTDENGKEVAVAQPVLYIHKMEKNGSSEGGNK